MRQFVADSQLDLQGCLTVEGKKLHYLTNVLRLSVGDMIYVRLPDGKLRNMTVAKFDETKHKVILQVAGANQETKKSFAKADPVESKNEDEIWLFMFEAKPPKMDLIVRQATECGISRIIPVEGAFCQKGSVESARKKSSPGDDRWQRIITEAREQSGSAVDTRIMESRSLEKALELWKKTSEITAADAFVLYERTEHSVTLHEGIKKNNDAKVHALFVGAEGGISPEEIELMLKNNIQCIHFATNILRCETAALYGTAALQNALTEKKVWK